MTTLKKRICAVCSAIALCFTFYISNITKAQADNVDYSAISAYDKTSIVEDLQDLNIDLFPKIEGANGKIIRFSEFCYTEKSLLKDYYSLYFYVYNPSEKPIQEFGNVVNIATAYDEEGKPVKYENVKLTLLDGADKGDVYPNRFFKFKIEKEEVRKAFYEMANSYALANKGERRYDIAGLQLNYKEGGQKMDLSYGKTYYMSGYAKGFGDGDESTLTARSNTLETVELDVKHTYYRTGDYNNFVCDELNTVYFSVPQELFEKYGNLQKIKAEWYEYKTSPVFVTSDENAYDALYPYIGKDIGGNRYDDLPWRVLWEEGAVVKPSGATVFLKSYNPLVNGNKEYWTNLFDVGTYITRFDWLFKQEESLLKKDDYTVLASQVKEYMNWYTNNHPEQGTFGKRNKYAENLFDDSIDEDRIKFLANPNDKRGYIVQEVDAGDTGKLTFEKDNSWWHELWYGVEYTDKDFAPIEQLTSADMSGLRVEDFAKQYYINETQAQTVYDDCLKMLENGGTPVLFRFAQTDYYASPARFDYDGNIGFSDVDGYVAQETVFLDFDVISLTFRSEIEGDTVIPVVADPIDIINEFTAPDEVEDNIAEEILKIILIMVVVIVLVSVILKILKLLFGWIFK